jgi:hypothetical protein
MVESHLGRATLRVLRLLAGTCPSSSACAARRLSGHKEDQRSVFTRQCTEDLQEGHLLDPGTEEFGSLRPCIGIDEELVHLNLRASSQPLKERDGWANSPTFQPGDVSVRQSNPPPKLGLGQAPGLAQLSKPSCEHSASLVVPTNHNYSVFLYSPKRQPLCYVGSR